MPESDTTAAIHFNLPFSSAEVVLNPDGRLSRCVDFFNEVFLPAVVGRDVRRVRECPVCNRVFAAFRVDASACRGVCTNTFNVERFRSREARQHYRANRKKYISAKRRWELKRQARVK